MTKRVSRMWKLPLPQHDNPLNELETALTYKTGIPKYALSAQEINNIEEIYARYEELHGKSHNDLLANGVLSAQTLEAIYNGYSEVQENNRLNELRSRLMLAADRCPCCSIGPVSDLDHHLPRSIYKAIAVYSSNLVPLCHKCNNKKRTVAGTSPDDSFIHVYYDIVPTDERFLIATTEITDDALQVNFDIEKYHGMSDDIYRMLKFQINRVKLNSRLKKEVNTFLCSHSISLDITYGESSNSEAVKELLLLNEQHFIKEMGLNDWRSSLLSSLANNERFCDGGFKKALGLV